MKEISEINELIEKIPYIDMASVTPEGMPWISPLWTVYDEESNFYWTSSPDSQHSINILNKDDVFITIYDSSVTSDGWALYAFAEAYELKDETEIQKAINIFYKRKGKSPRPVEDFINDAPRRMYKAVTTKFWINDYDKNRVPADFKIEVKLK